MSPLASPAVSPVASPVAVIACGALGRSLREVVAARRLPVSVHLLPPLLHNRPAEIAPEVERLAVELISRHERVVVAYADCGTYGALDEVCERLGLERLDGLHCYDVIAGAERVSALFADAPGTYLLTDFLVQSFDRTVVAQLGLDEHPELWPEYFGNYERVVWLAERATDRLRSLAEGIASQMGLPLETLEVGTSRTAEALESLILPAGGLPVT